MADVATRLRLSRGTIEHLESNRYNQLPGRTFARGYVRNYARILGLPVESVLSEFDQLVPDAPSSTPSDTAVPSARRNKLDSQQVRHGRQQRDRRPVSLVR